MTALYVQKTQKIGRVGEDDDVNEFVPLEETKGGYGMRQSLNKFLKLENKNFNRTMDLVTFYEVAEEMIISLQYFNLKQKEENMLKRMSSRGTYKPNNQYLDNMNNEIDK